MGEWSCPLTIRGLLRSMEFLFSFLVVAVGMGGWTCESSSSKNEFLVAVGVMYLVVSGVFIYLEGRDEVMPYIYVPVMLDTLFAIFSFTAAYVAVTDEKALQCGYGAAKAAGALMFINMCCIFASLLYSINDVFEDDNDDRPRVPKSQRLENQDESDNKVSGTVLPKGWSIHTTEEGYEYYFHAETGKSQWHAPS
mmetsp:Transcript_27859/g.38894  ORF Transcript_27859/g.38894 Transcript_27859/m.38894 type:complete len:195 (+) Transcript_27859:135-719(+)|eukprot:CAMPEP_0185251170 /NCGR_PEP_ID=MMETSP1359-20130426/621_1 /TAXON_ID=552665 /ORGANISM="Bigelowiella longifila, Strain CCMP242" /LENGTH=194 /DNA_ID=CAMNT_0027832957 /DNA_START=68 /DNA_END=652 /DNA_ORIENTATION=+